MLPVSPTNPEDTTGAVTHDDTGGLRWVGPTRVRGAWKIDEKTGELVELVRADSYAEQKEREARDLKARTLSRPSIVKP